jgi:hypothetical protein
MKNVSIEIGTVAVDGIPGGARDGAAMGRGIEGALGRLLQERRLSEGWRDREAAKISLSGLRLPAHATDAQIAEAVAAALYESLGKRS